MKNKEIADIFFEIAEMMEILGDNLFRINSYKKAARVLNDLTEDVELLSKENKLKDIPGIGTGMAEKITQYIAERRIDKYEELKREIPEGVIRLMEIPGMGPKTAQLVFKALNITNIEDLQKAVKEGKLRGLPGIGQKKEEAILKGIKIIKDLGNRILLGVALPIVSEMVKKIKQNGAKLVSPAGSLRRMKETVGDIDILVGDKDGRKIISDFVRQGGVKEVLAVGDTKGRVIVEGGTQVDIRVVSPDCFGAALQYFTGSKEHNVRLREIAKTKGLKINEYGIFKGDNKIGGEKEEDIYELLGIEWIPPVLREDRGEIEAAQTKKLPRLVAMEDIKCDLHVHSNWSDGTTEIMALAEEAERLGYTHIVISDHSQSLKIANGLDLKRIEAQIEEIKKINKDLKGFKLLCGSEVDIKADGSMDFPDSILKELDVVIGAIHTNFKQEKKVLTGRIIKAMENPNVDIIAHPTGRLIGAREAYDVDMNEIIKAAHNTKTALEINSHYDRLDLQDIWAHKAKENGVKMAIGTDAHHIDNLWMMRLGVGLAGRAWLEKKDILNTLSHDSLIKYLTN